MSQKVVWLFFAVTLTLWLGQIIGCSQTTEVDSTQTQSNASEHAVQPSGTAPLGATDQPGMWSPAPLAATAAPVQAATAPAPAVSPLAVSDQPKVWEASALPPVLPLEATHHPATVYDRLAWPTIKIGPASGKVQHGHVYFEDVRLGQKPASVENAGSYEEGINAAFAEDAYDSFTGNHALGLVVQPAKFGLDLITLPVRIFPYPPFETVTTPAQ